MASQYTVLILEPEDYSEKAIGIYRKLGPVYLYPRLRAKEKKSVLEKTEILVARLRFMLDAPFFDRARNLKIIATPTTGLNHIDMIEAKRRGIKVISLRGHSSFLKDIPSTAEETIGLILALYRTIPAAFEDVKKGNWNRDAWKGHQLIHKKIGLLGCGRLGKLVAKYARAFGMEVIGCDPYVDADTMKRFGIKKVSMAALFKESDIVSIHVLLTDETKNLVDENLLRLMKPAGIVVNTARAEIIKKGALEKALERGYIAGAAIDVMHGEKGDGSHLKNNRLLEYAKTHSNLIIVPHIGGATHEAMQATEDFIANEVFKSVYKERAQRAKYK